MYKVIFFCPDENVKLRGDLPMKKGLGGGKTAIIKIAAALRRQGCDVTIYTHCDAGIYDGIEYKDYKSVREIDCDIFIATSGSKCNLQEVTGLKIKRKLKIAWLTGAGYIKGIEYPEYDFDFYYTNSVFLRQRAVKEWGLPFDRTFTTYEGIDPEDFSLTVEHGRDPYSFVFASHPIKGLSRNVEIIERLRNEMGYDFRLHIYGDASLWGDESEYKSPDLDWIKNYGMINQPELCRRLYTYNFMLHLTDYEDTTSILLQQAKKAGIIVLASDVGGNSEIIEDGFDGFIIKDYYMDEICYFSVKKIIQFIFKDENYAEYLRKNAMAHSLTWDKIAKQWIEHWEEVIDGVSHKKKIVIGGYYGFKNLGDEAILSSIIKKFKRVYPDIQLIAVSNDPFYTEKMHRIETVHREDFNSQLEVVKRCNCVVLGGGGLFQDHHRIRISEFFYDHRYGITSYANLPLMGKIFKKPIWFLFQGVGPFFTEEAVHFSRWAFSLADLISVRDRYSYYLVTEVLGVDAEKVQLTYDAALTEDPPSKKRAISLIIKNNIPLDKELIVVAPRYWIDRKVEDSMVYALGKALKRFSERGFYIILLPFQLDSNENDYEICKRVADFISDENYRIITDIKKWDEIVSLYRWAKISVGVRYHSLVASLLANTPTIAVSYDKKDDEIMKEFGMSEYLVDINNVNSDIINKKIEDLLVKHESIKKEIMEILTYIQRKGDSMFYELP